MTPTRRIEYPWLFLINAIPFVLDLIFYFTGKPDDLVWFLPAMVILLVFNWRNSVKPREFLLLYAAVFGYILFFGAASTALYYFTISDDVMTPVVGTGITVMEVAVVVVLSGVAAIIKAFRYKKLQR